MICTQDEWGANDSTMDKFLILLHFLIKAMQLDNRGQRGDKGKVKEEEENGKGEFGKFVIRIQ